MKAKKSNSKPVLIVPKGELSDCDIIRLRQNHICVVEAAHPASVRYLDPPVEFNKNLDQASIGLVKWLLFEDKQCLKSKDEIRAKLFQLIAQEWGNTPKPVEPLKS